MGEDNNKIKSGKFTQEDVNAYTRCYTALEVEPILADQLTETEFREDVIDAIYFSSTKNPEYGRVAAVMLRDEIDRKTPATFCEAMRILADTHPSKNSDVTIVQKAILPILDRFGPELDQLCKTARKVELSYNGLKTLLDGYLEHVNGHLIERPEYMWMRVSLLQVPEDLESTKMYAGVNMTLSGIRIENGTVMDFVRTHFKLQAEQWATQASPTMFNAWKTVSQCASCFLTQIQDSMDDIYGTLRECALISQRGGGIGISVNRVRAQGSMIAKTNGKSQGTSKMLTVYDATATYANQGGKRKGAFAIYMSPDHADFMEFLEMRLPTGNAETRSRNLHHAIWMPDLFMKRVQAGEKWSFFCPNEAPGLCDVWGDKYEALYARYEREGRARFTKPAMDVWCSIIDIMCRTSEPYLLFKDHCNRKSNHQHLGTIQSSNLCCMTADQRIPTQKGLLTVRELFDDGTPNIVPGRGRMETATKMELPRPDAQIVRLHTREGYTHDVTPDHPVWVVGCGWTEAGNLEAGARIEIQQIEGPWGSEDFHDEALLAGLIAGDGTYTTDGSAVCLDIWDKVLNMEEEIVEAVHRVIEKHVPFHETRGVRTPIFTDYTTNGSSGKKRLHSTMLSDAFKKLGFTRETKLHVPEFVWRGDKQTVSAFLRGLYVTDGTVEAGEKTTVSLASVDETLLKDIQILWANFGVKTSLSQMREPGTRLLPDGHGGRAVYDCNAVYRLMATSIRACRIVEDTTGIGAQRGNDVFLQNIQKRGYAQKMWATFTHCEPRPNADAYCLTVNSDEHAWVANGLVTKNTEIVEYTSPDEIAVCNLASVALAKFVTPGGNFDFEGLEEVVGILTVALDNTIDRTYYPVDKARVSNRKHRPIGIGVQALSDVFLLMGYSWGDEAAIELQDRIFESIYFAFLRTSCNRARVLGTYESYKGSPVEQLGMLQHDMWNFPDTDNHDWEGLRADIRKHGLRNSLGVAPMPTVSTALIMDNTECIEPITSLMAVRRTKSGEFVEINKHLVRVLDERGLLDEDMMKEIKAARNSVQNIERIPPDVRRMFRTAFEIPEKTKLAHHVAMAKWVDQSFSRSMFVRWDDGSGTALQDRVSSALFAAWHAGLKTGMYYLRIRPEIEAAAVTVEGKKEKNEKKVENETGEVCLMQDGCLHCSS